MESGYVWTKITCALATNEVDVVITLIIMHQKDEATTLNIKNKMKNKSEQKKMKKITWTN